MNDENLTTAERELIEMAEADLAKVQAAEAPEAPAGKWQVVFKATGAVLNTYPTRAEARAAVKSANPSGNARREVTIRKSSDVAAVARPSKAVTKPKATKAAKSTTAKAHSKKDRALNIYRTAVKAGNATRKVVLPLLMSDLGLSKPGASTYFQNMKSGKWS